MDFAKKHCVLGFLSLVDHLFLIITMEPMAIMA